MIPSFTYVSKEKGILPKTAEASSHLKVSNAKLLTRSASAPSSEEKVASSKVKSDFDYNVQIIHKNAEGAVTAYWAVGSMCCVTAVKKKLTREYGTMFVLTIHECDHILPAHLRHSLKTRARVTDEDQSTEQQCC